MKAKIEPVAAGEATAVAREREAKGASLRFLLSQLGRGLSKLHFPGKNRLVRRLGHTVGKLCPEADCFPDPHGRFGVRLAGRIERFMWAGCYEPDLVLLLKRALLPGMVFVDVGAHIGYFTVLAAALVGPDGAVYAFEPDPECFERLILNTQSYAWVRLRQSAVGEHAGETTFFRSPRAEETGWGTIFPTGEPRQQMRVPMVTLDESLAEMRAQCVDSIKLDAEGTEFRILQGMRGTIDRFRPAVYFETNTACLERDGRAVADLTAFFTSRGYEIRNLPGRAGSALDALLAVPGEGPVSGANMARIGITAKSDGGKGIP